MRLYSGCAYPRYSISKGSGHFEEYLIPRTSEVKSYGVESSGKMVVLPAPLIDRAGFIEPGLSETRKKQNSGNYGIQGLETSILSRSKIIH